MSRQTSLSFIVSGQVSLQYATESAFLNIHLPLDNISQSVLSALFATYGVLERLRKGFDVSCKWVSFQICK